MFPRARTRHSWPFAVLSVPRSMYGKSCIYFTPSGSSSRVAASDKYGFARCAFGRVTRRGLSRVGKCRI
jgi:hypothetical protein